MRYEEQTELKCRSSSFGPNPLRPDTPGPQDSPEGSCPHTSRAILQHLSGQFLP